MLTTPAARPGTAARAHLVDPVLDGDADDPTHCDMVTCQQPATRLVWWHIPDSNAPADRKLCRSCTARAGRLHPGSITVILTL